MEKPEKIKRNLEYLVYIIDTKGHCGGLVGFSCNDCPMLSFCQKEIQDRKNLRPVTTPISTAKFSYAKNMQDLIYNIEMKNKMKIWRNMK